MPLLPDSMLPQSLLDYLRRGGEVRTDATAPMAGRCGGLLKEESAGDYCRRPAGDGTTARLKGRCRMHPDLDDGGLAPWMGELPEETQRLIEGDRSQEHGAASILLPSASQRRIDDLFCALLTDEEAEVYRAVPQDPIERLESLIRLQFAGMHRVQSWVKRRRALAADAGGVLPFEVAAGAERMLQQGASVVARLQEAVSRHMEAESAVEMDDRLVELLQQLSDNDLARIGREPQLLAAWGGGSLQNILTQQN